VGLLSLKESSFELALARAANESRSGVSNSVGRQEALQRLAAGEIQADIARSYAVNRTTIRRLQALQIFKVGLRGNTASGKNKKSHRRFPAAAALPSIC